MAYTNVWSNVIPAGTAAANTLDSVTQQLRLDINERMDVLVEDWTTDPVVPIYKAGDYRCVIKRDAVQSIPDITLTTVSWTGTDIIDVTAMHDPGGANPERITIPTGADGVYLFGCLTSWAASATASDRWTSFYKNGVVASASIYAGLNDASFATSRTDAWPILDAVATDYFEIKVYQNIGGALNLATESRFWCIRITP